MGENTVLGGKIFVSRYVLTKDFLDTKKLGDLLHECPLCYEPVLFSLFCFSLLSDKVTRAPTFNVFHWTFFILTITLIGELLSLSAAWYSTTGLPIFRLRSFASRRRCLVLYNFVSSFPFEHSFFPKKFFRLGAGNHEPLQNSQMGTTFRTTDLINLQ